jgi:pheromone a factor receptor
MVLKDMSYMYPIFPILGSITIVLCLFPVPAHWRAGNVATVSLALWTAIGIFMTVIDTCVWHGNIRNPHPVWGDIVQVYLVVLPDAIASTTLCIQYRLWSIARARTVFITKQDVRSNLICVKSRFYLSLLAETTTAVCHLFLLLWNPCHHRCDS